VPTLAFVQGQNSLLFGEIVRSRRLGFSQPQQYFQAFKRDLVAEYQPPARQIEGINYSAEVVSELFLKHVWQQLLQQGIEPSRLIFTVPVGAFELYLDWFRDFAERLNVPQVQLIDESTAAALGYAIQQPGSLVLVIDFGGGIKRREDVEAVFAAGAQIATIGSLAVKEPEIFAGWLAEFGGERILLGADVRGEKLAINGWQADTEISILPFLENYFDAGGRKAFCTDIAKDGLLEGASIKLYRKILEHLPELELIASGGVSSMKDVYELEKAGCSGAIVGKAIYENRITFRELEEFQKNAG